MATITLADYITLQDGTKRIDGQPNALNLVFDLPSDFVKGTNKAKPILQFKIGVHKPSDLQVWVNSNNSGTNIQLDATLSKHSTFRTYHEFVDGSKFKPGESNEIKFILVDHSIIDTANNDITIADVALIYQRRIEF
ncbi:MAG: hypothetical protein QNJ47_04110 [Nostocaceae cyanobacterium]|nr:hypothetical protein [Nostocaceae cyanobacterium]